MEEFDSDDETQHKPAVVEPKAPTVRHEFREPYVDADGVTMEWDADRQAFFPKIDEDFANQYLGSNYKANESVSWTEYTTPEGVPYYFNAVSNVTTWEKPKGKDVVIQKPRPVPPPAAAATETKAVEEPAKDTLAGKRKAENNEFFEMTSDKNTFVYVTGLPEDITEEEFFKFMQKCGIVAVDPLNDRPKIKLYRNEEGQPKGDGRCCYQRIESVKLALDILNGSEIKPGFKVTVTVAEFKQKENVTKAQRLKKTKEVVNAKKKAAKKADKSLAWFENDEERQVLKKVASVVVFKHMFDPKEFDADPTAITDIKADMEAECSKFGPVKKVLIFDRHPEGVISVRFRDPDSVASCIAAMHGRFFGGKKIEVTEWDGHTSYQIEETDAERDQRIKNWESFLKE